jgi:hypothetical protein
MVIKTGYFKITQFRPSSQVWKVSITLSDFTPNSLPLNSLDIIDLLVYSLRVEQASVQSPNVIEAYVLFYLCEY